MSVGRVEQAFLPRYTMYYHNRSMHIIYHKIYYLWGAYSTINVNYDVNILTWIEHNYSLPINRSFPNYKEQVQLTQCMNR